ncbi:hypothetical protein [Fodinicola feengrottensis]|uniref:Uncharacterized protein n=1 Tax=Fodinicola feengrottensis TaxID=435914 RepID=A0ABP4UT28_9ACTN|nr:hypothetical protein [Fodinicola feengrottensis]
MCTADHGQSSCPQGPDPEGKPGEPAASLQQTAQKLADKLLQSRPAAPSRC